MKHTAYFLSILFALLFISTASKAQEYIPNYQFAAGLKFGGYENGVSGKYFMNPTTAIEGLVGLRSPHGLVITGLYEINQTAFNLAELKFYYGAGAHVGSINSSYQRIGSSSQDYNGNTLLLGADAVVERRYG